MSINITSGLFNRFKINIPKNIIEKIRPTTSIARKSIFDSIYSFNEIKIVIDLFAGTGIFGFEAASRGIKNILFVDNSQRMYKFLLKNINLLQDKIIGLKMYAMRINAVNIQTRLKYLIGKIGLIFIDPPYDKTIFFVNNLLNNKNFCNWSDNALVILESSLENSRKLSEKQLKLWNIIKINKIGQSIFYFLKVNKKLFY